MIYAQLPQELLTLIQNGESLEVEFKKSTTDITKDVYDTVCAFSNRNGGHIFLGVKDNGTILGIQPDCVDAMKKNFVTSVNNENKMYPPLYLTPIEYEYDGKVILYIRVPVCSSVCRCNGRIFDRNHEADIDITNHSDEVYRLYARKSGSYFVNKVTRFGMDALRPDLIERAKKMTRVRGENHPWRSMSDDELLRSAGLILTDEFTQQEGITIAAILLFGKDSTIMSVLPQHKTDAIFRVQNLDRYDDRDVVITNLLESYDRLITFGEKHLNDTFHLEGMQSVSARDHILREIVSNLLMHRDFSSGYVAKMVIEKDKLYTENANLSHGYGILNLATFDPFQKNPPISKVFREIGLADELGSGMRNTYKYTKMYSGGEPQFVEGDVFRITIPLTDVATATVGPTSTIVGTQVTTQVSPQVSPQVTTQVKLENEKLSALLEYCSTARSRKEMQDFCGIKTTEYFRKNIIKPMLEEGLILQTIPDKPNSRNQKYVAASNV
ncbi:MAG: putative DNA binding domain-containing protein [bacterium]|nr:putative DNA binding domain-containing protein [bacterium]